MSMKKRLIQLPYGVQSGLMQKHTMTMVTSPWGWRFKVGDYLIHGVSPEPHLFKRNHYGIVRR